MANEEKEYQETDNRPEAVEQAAEETTQEVEYELDEALIGEDGEPVIFPGGPSISKVEEWKSRYGDIFLSEFGEDVFIWRPIRRNEYKQVMKVPNADAYYREERMCEAVVLFPEGYNFATMTSGKAGIPTMLSTFIMEKSGFEANTGAMKI